MNNYNKALAAIMSAIQNMVDKAIANAPFDQTYIGTIDTFVKTDGVYRIYKVKVNGIIKMIPCSKEHRVGDRVYILVPKNDWNNARIVSLE